MRTLRQNKQKLMYALLEGEAEKYVLDGSGNKIIDYVDDDGNIYYLTTGEKIVAYSDPVAFEANISMSGGEAQTTEFGVDITAYDATLVYLLNEFPIKETSLVWYESTPKIKNGYVDPSSADYKVVIVKPSLNYTKVLLSRLAK